MAFLLLLIIYTGKTLAIQQCLQNFKEGVISSDIQGNL